MRIASIALGCALLVSSAFAAAAQSQSPPEGRISAIIYLEARPSWTREAVAALRAYKAEAMKENGPIQIDVFQETGRPNRFLIDETWRDFAAWDAHAKSSKLAERFKAGHLAPPDTRAHSDWSVSPAATGQATEVDGFTHVDVPPPNLAALEALLKPFVETSRAEKGASRFDVLQGAPPRRNHLTLAEAWASPEAARAHQTSAHAIEFRDRLGPLLGALYDQRWYKRLD